MTSPLCLPVKSNPPPVASIAEAIKNAQTRIKAAQTSQRDMEKTLKQASADLEELQHRFGGST